SLGRCSCGGWALSAGVVGIRIAAAMHAGFVDGEFGGQVSYLFADALLDFRASHVHKDIGDPAADLLHLGFAHAARGDRWAAQADAAIAFVLATTCFAYSLKEGSMASFRHTALAAIV